MFPTNLKSTTHLLLKKVVVLWIYMIAFLHILNFNIFF